MSPRGQDRTVGHIAKVSSSSHRPNPCIVYIYTYMHDTGRFTLLATDSMSASHHQQQGQEIGGSEKQCIEDECWLLPSYLMSSGWLSVRFRSPVRLQCNQTPIPTSLLPFARKLAPKPPSYVHEVMNSTRTAS